MKAFFSVSALNTMSPLLTVGILTVGNVRELSLQRLLNALRTHKEYADSIEIIVNRDDGAKAVGEKRNEILDQATGLFVCFIDDDDMVHDQYVPHLVNIIRENPNLDCIGFSGMYHVDGREVMKFKHANRYGGHFKDEHGVQHRPVNHINPVRTEHARRVRFPHTNFSEDMDYCNRLLASGFIKNEIIVDEIMYLYLWSPSGTLTQ